MVTSAVFAVLLMMRKPSFVQTMTVRGRRGARGRRDAGTQGRLLRVRCVVVSGCKVVSHLGCLKPTLTPAGAALINWHCTGCTAAVKGSKENVIFKLKSKKVHKGHLKYLVSWVGHTSKEDTLESAVFVSRHLDTDILKAFEESIKVPRSN